jgi:hypothetical protein
VGTMVLFVTVSIGSYRFVVFTLSRRQEERRFEGRRGAEQ